MKYLFELGNHPELSRAEIEHVFLSVGIKEYTAKLKNKYLIVETEETVYPLALMRRLGGTLKIAQSVSRIKDPVQDVANFLDANVTDKIFLSLHADNAKKNALAVKKELKSRGRSVRYIESKNTATILHNNLIKRQGDLTIIDHTLFVTKAIQPIEALGDRDFGKPGRDSKSGMLPPKLAQILLNLSGIKKRSVVLDPFCGSGTVLLEAALMGVGTVIGSDLSEKAVQDSKKNIEWMREKYAEDLPEGQVMDVFKKNVSELSEHVLGTKVTAIATEPYMGKPLRGDESKMQLENQAKELSRLYIDAFRAFKKVLTQKGTVIFIIPQFKHGQNWVTIDCVEQIKALGFSLVPFSKQSPSLLYHRKGQHVGRMIYKFKMK